MRLRARIDKLERTAEPILKQAEDAAFWALYHATPANKRSRKMQREVDRRFEEANGIPDGFSDPALEALSDDELLRRVEKFRRGRV